MSSSRILKSSMIVGASVVALTLGACASSGSSSGSRYGNVYDYESGGSCNSGASCGAVVTPPAATTRYGSGTMIGGQPVSPGVVYTDCSQVSGMNCGAPAPVYTQPAPVYTPPAYTPPATSSYGGPVSCPSGTTPAGDGTCMMSGSGSYTGSTYSGTTTTSTSSSYGEAVSCPSGTTKANDGTCMMSGSGSTYTGYTSTTSSVSGGTVDCPSGTTRANDGTCMMSSGSNVTMYPTNGYTPPVDYTAPVYQPIRK